MDYYSYGNYGGKSGYPEKPVSALWSKARIQLRRYYGVLSRFGWILFLTVSLGVFIAAWGVSEMPQDYISRSAMIGSGHFEVKESAVYNEQLDNFYGTQIKLMKSNDVQMGALVRVQTLHPNLQPQPVYLDVSQSPHAFAFDLSVEAENGDYARYYLDAVMDEYLDQKKKKLLEESDSTTGAIQQEIERLDKEINGDDTAMSDFQKANAIGFIEKEGNDAALYLDEKNKELADLKIEYNLLQMLNLDQNLDRQMANPVPSESTPSPDGTSNADPTNGMGPVADYQKAKQELELLKARRAELSHVLRPAHPTIIDLDQQIEKENDLIQTLRSESADALKTRRESIAIQIKNLEGVITEWQAKALDLSGRISDFDRLKAKADRDKEEYEHMVASKNGVNVTKTIDSDAVTIGILEHASAAESVKPGWPEIILFGSTGGLLVGLLILFCIDQLDDRVGSFLELQGQFSETILGQIPREKFGEEGALLRHNDDRLALLESFRSLRSSLIYFPVEGARPKTLIVTSAVPNEGKTTISANLAITLAFSGARTLIVDADMRRGKLSSLFGVAEESGLSTILLGQAPWREVAHQTTIENLSLISCGPALKHPAEHLLGKITDQFLKDVYEQFDYVIFDSPPVTLLDDTLSLAPKIDGTLVIVRFGISSARATRRTLDLLAQRQTNILGLVCNDVHISESEYNYGYYYRQTMESYSKGARATV